ncbi:MAG TPA: D-mannonate oxidoreductase [Lentisphaeria bacterium]|nr:MAG: D-mannonate oxidoreductase [Lentisphaerae bacterium GWF2_38_69]HBM15905.1 D-mannonate oxidoreductase [Lentisphaeria bacterium]
MKLPFTIDLKDKVSVVTGGGGVLGEMMAEALAMCGSKVAILDLNKDAADKTANKLTNKGLIAKGFKADVLSLESVKQANEEITATFGKCDILINGAGGNHPKGTTSKEYLFPEDLDAEKEIITFFSLDSESIKFVFNLNFIGTLIPTQVFAKGMVGSEKHPVIINISSMNAFCPLTKIPAYSGAKAAVSNFTQWLAVHFSKVGIRVNAIAPGFFETNQNKKLLRNEDGTYTERANKIVSHTPMGRFGEAEELIGTLLWLVSNEASGFVNGVIVPVDGGFNAYSGV